MVEASKLKRDDLFVHEGTLFILLGNRTSVMHPKLVRVGIVGAVKDGELILQDPMTTTIAKDAMVRKVAKLEVVFKG